MQLRHQAPFSTAKRPSAARSVTVRAVAEPATKAPAKGTAPAPPPAAGPASGAATKRAAAPEHFINVIPRSAWENGIPPVMGAHLMASGSVAPISTSKGAGDGVEAHQFQYPDPDANIQVVIYATPKNAARGVAKLIAEQAAAAVKARGAFTLVLSGGSALSALAGLPEARAVDWSKVHVFFADERNVAHSSGDSNFKAAGPALLDAVPVPRAQVHAIKEGLSVEQAALEYEGRLLGLPDSVLPRDASGNPVFDCVVLGVGPDGHVASLFPNRPELSAASGRWVLPVSASPKPPPERITLSLPAINAAKEVMIVALGEGKAEIVARALECQSLPGALPAQLVRPGSGRARWVLDAFAAQELNVADWEAHKEFPRNL